MAYIEDGLHEWSISLEADVSLGTTLLGGIAFIGKYFCILISKDVSLGYLVVGGHG